MKAMYLGSRSFNSRKGNAVNLIHVAIPFDDNFSGNGYHGETIFVEGSSPVDSLRKAETKYEHGKVYDLPVKYVRGGYVWLD